MPPTEPLHHYPMAAHFLRLAMPTSISITNATMVTSVAMGALPRASHIQLLSLFHLPSPGLPPSVSIPLRHVYTWYNTLTCILRSFSSRGQRAYTIAMQWRRLASITATIICLAGAKPCHKRTASLLRKLFHIVRINSGLFVSQPSRLQRLNSVYIIFSPFCGYSYIGESNTGAREFQHFAMTRPTSLSRRQRVHRTMRSVGPDLFCILPFTFPRSFNRRAYERALIATVDSYGKYLLNVKHRKCTPRSTLPYLHHSLCKLRSHKSITRRTNSTRTSDPTLTSSFHRPYLRLLPPTPPLPPCKIPTAIWFSGGAGGVTMGLLKTGCYDVRVAVECDPAAAASHRRLYPSIPVLVYTLGGCIDTFITGFARYVPSSCWDSLCIQASPPCRFSRNATPSAIDDALHLTRWTITTCLRLRVKYFWIATVPYALDLLDNPGLYSTSYDLSFYVPQKHTRAIIANFPVDDHLTRLSDTHIPAASVLPHIPVGSSIISQYRTHCDISLPAPPAADARLTIITPTSPSRSLTVRECQVLQGFPFSMDFTHGSKRQQYRWLGRAVSPPLALCVGHALLSYHTGSARTSTSFSRIYVPIQRSSLPCRPSLFHCSIPHSPPSCDLADILHDCATSTSAMIRMDIGICNTSTTPLLARFQGTATFVVNSTVVHASLSAACTALIKGYVPAIVVHNTTFLDNVSKETLTFYRDIARLRFGSGSTYLPRILSHLTYREVYELYRQTQFIPECPQLVTKVRYKLTVYSKLRFGVRPNPRFRFAIPAEFGLSREACRSLCYTLIRDVAIPPVVRDRIIADMPISFTTTPSVGDIVCNFRSYCRGWMPHTPWACTCDSLREVCGIASTSATVATHPVIGEHINARFSDCSGRFDNIFTSNLRDKCAPAPLSLIKNLLPALGSFLRLVRRFATSIRDTPLSQFHTLCMGVNPTLRVDHDLIPIVRLVRSLGFTFSKATHRALHSLISSTRNYSPPPSTPIPTTSDASLFRDVMSSAPTAGVIMYLDKNSGMGSVVCPSLYWKVLHDSLWANPDYVHTNHTDVSLHRLHHDAYASGGWSTCGFFRTKGTAANEPFLFGKNKSNLKYRTVLSAYSHCLKYVHARVAHALRFCLLSVTADNAFDMNLPSTLDTPANIQTAATRAISQLAPHHRLPLGVDCYAGDISSMFDKLPCTIVMQAVEYVLYLASSSTSKYNLRQTSRSGVTINLDHSSLTHLGPATIDSDRIIHIPFDMIIDVCKHYCFHSYFQFGGTIFRLVLGIPQGGSMSDPLSKIYCTYCEHKWRDSLFDHQRFHHHLGLIRLCDMTDAGFRAVSNLIPFPLDRRDTTPIVSIFFRRYADDCRCVAYYCRDVPAGRDVAAALITLYTTQCYIKPCELEDEERGTSFPFLQGFFHFHSSHCNFSYLHKNGPSLLANHPRSIRSLQHYWSYGQSCRTLRLATLCGKLCEIRHFCSTDSLTILAVLSLCVEFKSLDYPTSVIVSALHRQYTNTQSEVWQRLAHAVPRIL